MKEQSKDRVTVITVLCKDGSKRIMKPQGSWNHYDAQKLGMSVENENFSHVIL